MIMIMIILRNTVASKTILQEIYGPAKCQWMMKGGTFLLKQPSDPSLQLVLDEYNILQ